MTPEAVDVALDAGADMVGFVFFPPSPRHLGFEAARALGARVRGRAKKVALSVDADDDLLAASIEALKPDMLQLHGNETPGARRRVRTPVRAAGDEGAADRDARRPVADPALCRRRRPADLRCAPPRDATRPGGLGRRFDWTLLAGIDPGVPFMLSGGLDAGNVAEALRITRAPARRCVVRRRTLARRQGSGQNPRLRARRACSAGTALAETCASGA